MSRDMLEFVGFAQQTVHRGMERELAATEQKVVHDQEKVRGFFKFRIIYRVNCNLQLLSRYLVTLIRSVEGRQRDR